MKGHPSLCRKEEKMSKNLHENSGLDLLTDKLMGSLFMITVSHTDITDCSWLYVINTWFSQKAMSAFQTVCNGQYKNMFQGKK